MFHFFFRKINLKVSFLKNYLFQVPHGLPVWGLSCAVFHELCQARAACALSRGVFCSLNSVHLKVFSDPLGVVPLLYRELSVLVFHVDLEPGLLSLHGLDDAVLPLFLHLVPVLPLLRLLSPLLQMQNSFPFCGIFM